MSTVTNDLDLELIHTGIEGAGENDAIMITRRALDKVLSIRTDHEVPEEYLLRLGTQSGCCSGMNYVLGFDSEITENDKIIEIANMNLLVDNKSIFYLMGVTLDYIDDMNGSGFIFNDPNRAFEGGGCGCGSGGGGCGCSSGGGGCGCNN